MGAMNILRDLGREAPGSIFSDAQAAISVGRRTGSGGIRHLDTRMCWLQYQVRRGTFTLNKVDGWHNPADLGTKFLPLEDQTSP